MQKKQRPKASAGHQATKICARCGVQHPATDDFFYRTRGYLCSPCKACYAQRNVPVNKFAFAEEK